MAVKDVKEYYKKVESQYFEMLADSKDYTEALQAGFLTEEQVASAMSMINRLKDNYLRLSYIMMLLNEPQKKDKKKTYKKMNSKIYENKTVEDNSADAVILENSDILKDFKLFVSELKDK